MGSRLKEDEKNEKAIRSLLRKTPNRRCINCNSLGPQYVCSNFWTFVCTQCSGIHREFTHRVKSVSMSKFTSQEVSNLESGGNERGREIYFKDWDSQRQPLPDSSNVDRLREFIKMVYVEKRFSGERPLPQGRGGDREEVNDNRRPEPRPNYRADSRSPPYEDRYDERPPGGRRSNAGYDDRRFDDRGTRYDEKRSPGRFETDRNRYDRNYNDNRRYEERPRYENRDRQQYEERLTNEGLDRRFQERFTSERGNRDYGGSSPPPILPVKEILGEDVPPLRVENRGSQTNGGREMDKSRSSQDGRGQRFGSSSSFGSVDGNVSAVAPVVKIENSTSLIDFSAEPDPPAAMEQPDPFGLTAAVQPSAGASSSTGWATFDIFSTAATAGSAALAPSSGPALAPAPTPASAQVVPGGFTNPITQINGNAQWAAQWPAASVASALESGTNSWSSPVGPSIPAVSSQPWSVFPANSSAPNALPAAQIPTGQDIKSVNSSAGVTTHVTPVQPAARPEIPQDFFGGSQTNLQFTGGPPLGPQYPSIGGMGMLAGNYNQPQKSRNPFDLPGDSSIGPAVGEFPSLTSMQAALPNLNMSAVSIPGPGLGAYGPQWSQTNTMVPPQASYPPAPVPSASGLFVGQQLPIAMPQTMQGSLGPSFGGGMPGSFLSVPKQSTESFFPAQSFSHAPLDSFGGGRDPFFSAQGAGARFPLQNPVWQAGGNAASSNSFFPGQVGQQRLISQSSVGSISSMPGADSLFPTQPPLQGGQRLLSHNSLGSLSSMTGTDTQFPMQAPSQFHTQSSLGPVGNPFG